MRIYGRSMLIAAGIGIAAHLLLMAAFTIQFSAISASASGNPIAANPEDKSILFIWSLLVDILVAVVYVHAAQQDRPIALDNGALGAAVSSILAKVVLAGISIGLLLFSVLYEFMNIGDRRLSPIDLQANPLLGPVIAAGSAAFVYKDGLSLLLITLPVAVVSGAVFPWLLSRERHNASRTGGK